MNTMKFNFFKKERENEMYSKIVNRLIKNGYKPMNNITYSYSFDCKQTKTSFFSPKYTKYPYSITIKYGSIPQSFNEYKLAA